MKNKSCKNEEYQSWKMVLKALRDRIHYLVKGAAINGDPALRRELFKKYPLECRL
jgi:hypothetical protein